LCDRHLHRSADLVEQQMQLVSVGQGEDNDPQVGRLGSTAGGQAMKNTFLAMAAAMLAVAWTTATAAESNQGRIGARPPLGTNPNPIIWGSQPAKPAPPAPTPPPAKPPDRPTRDAPRPEWNRSSYYSGRYYPYCSGTYAYDPYYGYGYPYPYYPPYYVSADALYGPQAVLRFMGADDGPQLRPAADMIGPAAREPEKADVPEPKRGVERATNARATALAWRFIGFGDARMAQQEFADANGRYRKASQAAPQLADAWFRQAFALSAMGRYDQAMTAIKHGLRIDPNWAKSDFDLKELYGADKRLKDARLEALARAADGNPNDANLQFLVGIHLHFDGQPQRAQEFFQRAKKLTHGDDEHIRAFLAK
jgi:Tfp pilus assembly protein PilF